MVWSSECAVPGDAWIVCFANRRPSPVVVPRPPAAATQPSARSFVCSPPPCPCICRWICCCCCSAAVLSVTLTVQLPATALPPLWSTTLLPLISACDAPALRAAKAPNSPARWFGSPWGHPQSPRQPLRARQHSIAARGKQQPRVLRMARPGQQWRHCPQPTSNVSYISRAAACICGASLPLPLLPQ